MISTLDRLFARLNRLSCFCASLAVHSFAVYSALGCLHNGNGKEYNVRVSVRYNNLLISLPFFTKQQREIVTFCILKVNYDDQLLPQSVGSFSSFSNGTKRNMTNPSKKYPRNVRVAMSKISLDWLTLDRRPICGTDSLTLVISWLSTGLSKLQYHNITWHNFIIDIAHNTCVFDLMCFKCTLQYL